MSFAQPALASAPAPALVPAAARPAQPAASRPAAAGLAGQAVDELLAACASQLDVRLGVIIEQLDLQAGVWQYSLDAGAHWRTIRTDILNRPAPMGLALAPEARLRVQPFAGSAHRRARIVLHAAQSTIHAASGCYCPYAPEGRSAAARSIVLELALSAINATPAASAPRPRNKGVRAGRAQDAARAPGD